MNRTEAAHHEAAHSVANILLGIAITRVSIATVKVETDETVGRTVPLEGFSQIDLRRKSVAFLAGGTGWLFLRKESPADHSSYYLSNAGAEDDHNHVRHWCMQAIKEEEGEGWGKHSSPDCDLFRATAYRETDFYNLLIKETYRLLHCHSELIADIAEQLLAATPCKTSDHPDYQDEYPGRELIIREITKDDVDDIFASHEVSHGGLVDEVISIQIPPRRNLPLDEDRMQKRSRSVSVTDLLANPQTEFEDLYSEDISDDPGAQKTQAKLTVEQFLERLTDKCEIISSKIEMLEFIDKELDSDEGGLAIYPAIFTMVRDALLTDIIVRLHSIFARRTKTGVTNFLARVHTESANIDPGGHRRVKQVVDSFFQQIENEQEILRRVGIHRDKYRAHTDEKYFADPDTLEIDAPLAINDFHQLSNLLREIVVFHRWVILDRDYTPGIVQLSVELDEISKRLRAVDFLIQEEEGYDHFAKAREAADEIGSRLHPNESG